MVGVRRFSDSLEEWEQESKRRRMESAAVKLECDDANDAYAFPSASDEATTAPAPTSLDVPAPLMLAPATANATASAPASALAPVHPMPV